MQLAEMAVAVPQVVGHRVACMTLAGPAPSARDRREFERMVDEKAVAFAQSWQAMFLRAWQIQQAALIGHAKPLTCLVQHEGQLVAGGVGRTEYGRLFVLSLWVHSEWRSQGIATEILRRMELEALLRGCTSSLIETLDDRVAGLYRRLGYESIAHIRAYVGPFDRHIQLKPLVQAAA
ncbi:MAG: GNAT family N-acetyltransferase [Rubrivivax sp.]